MHKALLYMYYAKDKQKLVTDEIFPTGLRQKLWSTTGLHFLNQSNEKNLGNLFIKILYIQLEHFWMSDEERKKPTIN